MDAFTSQDLRIYSSAQCFAHKHPESAMIKLRTILFTVLFCASAFAQTTSQPAKPAEAPKPATPTAPPQATSPESSQPQAKPEDVKSIDAIIAALYDVISGPPGPRDWNRFRSLFIPEARMLPTGKRPDGTVGYRAITPEDYVQRSGAMFLKEGFFETGIANRVDQYGTIAHVFSTYEARHEKGGQPFVRGINSIQLLNKDDRWWVVTIMWSDDRSAGPVPEKYMKSSQ